MNDLRRWGSHVKRAALSHTGDTLVFGAAWDKSSTSTLIRTDASANMVANAGVDNQVVRNDLDYAPIFSEMTMVTDAYGNEFIRIPKFYIHKTDTENLKTWKVSKTKYNGFYLPYCFWDFTNNRELPYID